MPSLDAFSTQIVRLVREMSDDEILALVRQQLDSTLDGTRPNGAQQRPSRTAAGQVGRRARATAADRQALLADVERVVKNASGLSARQVAAAAGVAQTRATAAIKELKQAKRIFQGGDRRFARYAGNGKTAKLASLAARKGSR